MFKAIVAVVCLVLLSSAYGKDINLDDKNNATTVRCAVNDNIYISLRGRPTTGHKWNTYAVYGNAVIENGEPTYTPDHNHPGAGGIYMFPFVAGEVGVGEVRLVEGRSWESKPFQVFVVKFDVRNADIVENDDQ